MHAGAPRTVPHGAVTLKGRNRILTTVKHLLLALFAAASLAAGSALPATAASAPRVLAIHFDAEVNPATQDWLNNQLDRAASGGYSAAVIVLE